MKATLREDQATFIEVAIGKAVVYSGFRNRIAHAEPVLEADKDAVLPGAIYLVEGKHGEATVPQLALTAKRLNIAAFNFGTLAHLLREVLETLEATEEPMRSWPRKYAEQVEMLPNPPDAPGPSRKQLGRQRQRTVARS